MADEKEIIRGLKSADPEEQGRNFKMLHDRYFNDLSLFVLQYVKSCETAREIAHDAFVRLWMHRNNLDADRPVRAYLFTISKNSLIKELRRQLRNPLLRDYIEFSGQLSTEARISYDYDVFIGTVEKAKLTLSPRQREIFVLNKESGMPVKEIASRLGIREQVVRNQLSAAVKKIRWHIAGVWTDEGGRY